MGSLVLPQEIILILCETLAARGDFVTLFRCSLVSRRVAIIALQQIYSIQDSAPASTGSLYSKFQWTRLWRSIVLSSLGETAFPYCAYIRTLSLGNLEECIQDIGRDKKLRSIFFEGPMGQFLVSREPYRPNEATSQTPLPFIDYQATMVKCAVSITEYIGNIADATETAVVLEHLEFTYIPHDILPPMITRLGSLTSLRVRDGSVLGVEAATAISQCCPKFAELTCYYCKFPYDSSTADEDLAAFFRVLPANSLRGFEVISRNRIGEEALTALNAHGTSLRSLRLGDLTPPAIRALNMLPNCTALEVLDIENFYNPASIEETDEQVISQAVAWVSACKSLRTLRFRNVLNALPIIRAALSSPEIRLTTLSILGFQAANKEESSTTWAALGTQDQLESLTLGLQDWYPNNPSIDQNPSLLNSICRLKNLTALNLMQAYVTPYEIEVFISALPKLCEFGFSGDMVNDTLLGPLSTLTCLKFLHIHSNSTFSFKGLYHDFATKFNTPDRRGIKVEILNQLGDYKLNTTKYSMLQKYFRETLGGRIEISYFMDPDELHETDFSDDSDE